MAALMRQTESRAWESTARVEEKEHGHITVQPNESVLFFDSKYPPARIVPGRSTLLARLGDR
jgi:hypothetical protein